MLYKLFCDNLCYSFELPACDSLAIMSLGLNGILKAMQRVRIKRSNETPALQEKKNTINISIVPKLGESHKFQRQLVS